MTHKIHLMLKPNKFLTQDILLHPIILFKLNKFLTRNILLHPIILIKPKKFLTRDILLHPIILIKPKKFLTRDILLHPIILIKPNKFLTRHTTLHRLLNVNCRFYFTLTNFSLGTSYYTARQMRAGYKYKILILDLCLCAVHLLTTLCQSSCWHR